MALRVHIGIDPGVTGAYSVFVDGDLKNVKRLPIITTPATYSGTGRKITKETKHLDIGVLAKDIRAIRSEHVGAAFAATIERVGENAFGPAGQMSIAKLAGIAGEIRGVLGALGIPFEKVMPISWKKPLGIGKDKDKSRQVAMKAWPWLDLNRKNQSDLAEAALIGAYGARRSYE